jgi:RNA polymerase sigma-70 factor (ECF subfamily)
VQSLDGVFRREWGSAVAAIARWSGDLTVAEDAVQEACADALRTWPRDGTPANPGAWLVTAARNRARDRLRRESVRPGRELAAVIDDITARTDRAGPHRVRDDELRMMFTCAHPALERASQLALTLRLVSGLTVAEIARALLQSEAAVAQRITRAKTKIRHANIPLRVPRPNCCPSAPARAVVHLLGVHRGLLVHRRAVGDPRRPVRRRGAALRRDLHPGCPANWRQAVAALVLLHDSRRSTRVDNRGSLVPLEEQDRRRWDRAGSAAAWSTCGGRMARPDRTCPRP